MLISKRSKFDGFPIGYCLPEKRCEKRLKSRNELLISKLRMYCNLQYIRAPHATMYCNLQYILDLEIGRSFLLIGLFSSRNFAIHAPELKVSIWSEKWGATANSHILKLSIRFRPVPLSQFWPKQDWLLIFLQKKMSLIRSRGTAPGPPRGVLVTPKNHH